MQKIVKIDILGNNFKLLNSLKTYIKKPVMQLLKIKIFFLIPFLVLSFSVFGENKTDDMLGQRAEFLSGKKALGTGLLKLSKLMMEIGYKKGPNGKFIEKDGKFVLAVSKNVVVLNFFSTSCIPCMKEIPTYNRLADKYRKKPVKMIYVNVDVEMSASEIARFIARKQIKVPMMMPNQREAVKKYKVISLPRMVIIDKNGKIAHIVTGFKEDLEAQLSDIIDGLIS